jgi:hypothetical protein
MKPPRKKPPSQRRWRPRFTKTASLPLLPGETPERRAFTEEMIFATAAEQWRESDCKELDKLIEEETASTCDHGQVRIVVKPLAKWCGDDMTEFDKQMIEIGAIPYIRAAVKADFEEAKQSIANGFPNPRPDLFECTHVEWEEREPVHGKRHFVKAFCKLKNMDKLPGF